MPFPPSVFRAQLDKLLQECNFPSVAIHANMKQEDRIKMYQSFKDFKHRILVSTDIWGRESRHDWDWWHKQVARHMGRMFAV